MGTVYIDALLTQIQATPNPLQLNHTIKTALTNETRDIVLSSFVSNGQDPLSILDLRAHTLGALYILSARLHANYQQSPPPSWGVIRDFCALFNPDHARIAPERVTKLAKGIARLAAQVNNPVQAIHPLRDLVARYPPDPSFLTTIHPIFTTICAATRNFPAALPILQNPITDVSLSLSPDLHYNDNLTYHYTGGIILAALKLFSEAETFFELVVTAPGTYPSAIQFEALKKLKLVQLISTGKTSPLPKYAHPTLTRLFKSTPYQTLISSYPHKPAALKEIAEKEKGVFGQDRNYGLVMQAIGRAPRWQVKKLTETYMTLHLGDIAKVVAVGGKEGEKEQQEAVRALLLNMIEAGDISAKISHDGSVTFSDLVPSFSSSSPSSSGSAQPISKQSINATLRNLQVQSNLLQSLELELSRSKEYLTRAVKHAGGGPGGPGGHGGMGGGSSLAHGLGLALGGGEGQWDEEMLAAVSAAGGAGGVGWDDMYA